MATVTVTEEGDVASVDYQFPNDTSADSRPAVKNLCDFDIATIRKHCLCAECQDLFTAKSPQELMSLFENNCPGCHVRTGEQATDDTVDTPRDDEVDEAGGINDQFLVCSLGKRRDDPHYMVDAQYLPCFHHSCRNCLNQEAIKQHEDNPAPDSLFCCPECNSATSAVKIDTSGKVVFEGNEIESSTIKNIADIYKFERRLVDKKEKCDHCPVDDRKLAIAECSDELMMPLCEECLRRHKSGRATSDHKIMHADDLKTLVSLHERFLHYKHPPTCGLHKDQKLCMYCPKHKMVVCVMCSREEDHEDCKGLFEVSAHFDEESHVATLKKLMENAESLSGNIDSAIRSIEFKVKSLSSHCNAIVSDINRRSSSLKQEIENQREFLVLQTQKVKQLKEDDFNSHLQHLQAIKKQIDDSLGWITSYTEAATPINFFLLKHKMEDRLESFSEYKTIYQEDDKVMNAQIFHDTNPSLGILPKDFGPFCKNFFGQVYSTPCLEKYTIKRSDNPFVLTCRDIHGTKLYNYLPNIHAQLKVIEDLIDCRVEKKPKKGIYIIKLPKRKLFPGLYSLLISYENPPDFFLASQHGKTFDLNFSNEKGFEIVTESFS